MRSLQRSQSGFTLIEIAIVLVIIGLLLGGVLKGTELIENSKVKRAMSEINGTVAAFYAYQDRYNRIPGDDGDLAALRARGGSWGDITQAGNNDGQLAILAPNMWIGDGEGDDFWQHLKASGFVGGDPSAAGAAALPRNAFGGLLGIVTQNNVLDNLRGIKVCLSQVPGKSAVSIDNQLDDGVPDEGRVRSSQGNGGGNAIPGNAPAAYNEEFQYTVCSQL